VLSRGEVLSVLREMQGLSGLVANLLYGAGLRLMEALSIRVKDLSFDRGEIVIRSGKGGHDRVAILPDALKGRLLRQADRVRVGHIEDVGTGGGFVDLPGGLARKVPSAARDLSWQYLFPATRPHQTAPPANAAATIFTRAPYNATSPRRPAVQTSGSGSHATRSVTRSPRIFSRTATTYAPFRSFSGIGT
jgi:integrase